MATIQYTHKKVSQLPPATPATGTEEFPVVQGGVSRKANATWIKEFVGYDAESKQKLGDLPTKAELDVELNKKQNAEDGKGLSTEDYTTAEKQAVATVEKRVRYDAAQTLTPAEQDQVIDNIGLGSLDPLAYYILAKA
jgi:hypothetical protein